MSQVPAGLHADDEVGRSPRRPRLEGLRLGQAVEGVVDLNGGEVAGGGSQPPPSWAAPRGGNGLPPPLLPPPGGGAGRRQRPPPPTAVFPRRARARAARPP